MGFKGAWVPRYLSESPDLTRRVPRLVDIHCRCNDELCEGYNRQISRVLRVVDMEPLIAEQKQYSQWLTSI